MKRQWSDMTYNRELGCWFVHLEGREFMLHCGEWFDLSFGKTSIPCRLELDRKWYVFMGGVRFYLHPKETYKIEM
jgi:hypothetical protein